MFEGQDSDAEAPDPKLRHIDQADHGKKGGSKLINYNIGDFKERILGAMEQAN